MSIEPLSSNPSPTEIDSSVRIQIDDALGRRSLFTTNHRIYALIEKVAADKGINPIKVQVTEKGFEPNAELVRIFEEGIPPEILQRLINKYGNDWFDELTSSGSLINNEGIDPSTFSAFIEVASDVNPENPEYDKFSNLLRWLNQTIPGFETVLYAPNGNLVHTEFRVRSESIE